MKGKYIEITGNRLKELLRFQHFLCINFIIMKVIKMKSDSNQPACLYGTAKTHMFENLDDITIANLKFRLSLIRLEQLRTMRQKLYRIIIIITYYYCQLIIINFVKVDMVTLFA